MKKLFIILIAFFVVLGISAQKTTIKKKYDAVTVNGTGTGTTTFDKIAGEWDVSIQMIPALAGEGDSVHYSHVMYLSDSYSDDAWSSVSSADTVSSVTDSDAIVWWSDMKSLRIKAIYTGLSSDTITITPYAVYKKHKKE